MLGVIALGRDGRQPTKSFISSTARNNTLGRGAVANKLPIDARTKSVTLNRNREGFIGVFTGRASGGMEKHDRNGARIIDDR